MIVWVAVYSVIAIVWFIVGFHNESTVPAVLGSMFIILARLELIDIRLGLNRSASDSQFKLLQKLVREKEKQKDV